MRKFSWLGLALTLVLAAACGDDSAPNDAGDARADAVLDGSVPPTGVVGSACVEDADCLAGLSCFEGPDGARAWPGGYCTRACGSAGDCPGGSVCGIAYGDTSGTVNLCEATCAREDGTHGGCREGYRCGWQGFCIIGCSSDDQCQTNDTWPGPPDLEPSARCELSSGRCLHGTSTVAEDGDACASNADCRPPGGRCLLGVCMTVGCDLGGPYACGAAQECVGLHGGFDSWAYFCATSCRPGVDGLGGTAADDRCPPRFMCAPPESDPSGHATQPYCALKLRGVGTSDTATIGSPCTTEADCPLALGYSDCVDGACVAQFCAAPFLASEDICGPGSICFAPDGDRANLGWESVQLSLGFCQRDCSTNASLCEAPTSCVDGACITGAL